MRIGVLGAGQLGRMLAQAAACWGWRCTFLDPQTHAPALALGDHIHADYDNPTALAELASCCDVVTYEFENIPVAAVEYASAYAPVYPSVEALRVSQHRSVEKDFFQSLGIPTARYASASSEEALAQALKEMNSACIVKTQRMGYDGKGQYMAHPGCNPREAWEACGLQPVIVEEKIPFDCEMSLIGARNTQGEMVFYPLIQNTHRSGILHTSLCPAPQATEALQNQAQQHMRKVMEALDYVGVLTLEFFLVNGVWVANEMAPRVHNSGHLTMEGCVTSQFENHVRAITGAPLGSTTPVAASGMFNMVGRLAPMHPVLSMPYTHWHDYHKTPRPQRKMGHITVGPCNAQQVLQTLADIEKLTGGAP
jgi:5-(carboxyamino)imidazole ribonucleotide synthase